MKKFNIYMLLWIVISNFTYPQTTFEYLHQTTSDERPVDMIEDDSGNIILSYFDLIKHNTNLIKIDNSGQVVTEFYIYEPNGRREIKDLVPLNDSIFIGLGVYINDTINSLWYCRFDFDLNLLYENTILVDSILNSYYIHSTINQFNNLVVGTVYKKEGFITDLCLFELTINGELLKNVFYNSSNPGLVSFYDILEIPNSTKYKVFTTGFYQKSSGHIWTIDSAFNILYFNPFDWANSQDYSVKLLDDDNYLLGLSKSNFVTNYKCADLVKHSFNEIASDSILICDQNKNIYPAPYNSVDFINNSDIYFGGTYDLNISNPIYSTVPSWLMLNKLDENLEIQWQKFYGGDVYYVLWSILATQDGGCVMAGSRYDYQTQNQECDVYILKVNEDGMLTWTYNFPETTRQVIVYPNPGRDEIWIKAIENNLRFDLFDINGNKILSQPIEKEDNINTSHLQKGVYTYRILNQKAETIETGKWIKD
jgi:hypothetical protein